MDEKRLTCPPEPEGAAELRGLVQRAQAGDASVLPRIREILGSMPEVWQQLGDISALAERAWIAVLAADHPLAVESMRRTIAEMRADLAGEQPTRLEQMLIDQVIATWLECKYLESTAADPGHGSLDQAGFRLKRLESAQRRHLTAIKTLTQVRSLMPAQTAPVKPVTPGSLRIYDPDGRLRSA